MLKRFLHFFRVYYTNRKVSLRSIKGARFLLFKYLYKKVFWLSVFIYAVGQEEDEKYRMNVLK